MSGFSRKQIHPSCSGVWEAPVEIFHCCLGPRLVEKIPAKLYPAMSLLHKFLYFGTAFFEVLLSHSGKLPKDISDIVIYHVLWKNSLGYVY